MEYIIYVLLSVALISNGNVNIYEPKIYYTEEMCEYNKQQAINAPKPDIIVSFDVVCAKVVLSHESI